jgi:hypothetical protein
MYLLPAAQRHFGSPIIAECLPRADLRLAPLGFS